MKAGISYLAVSSARSAHGIFKSTSGTRPMLWVLAACCVGCSWIGVRAVPDPPPSPPQPIDCTSSNAAPVLDTVGAAVFLPSGVANIIAGATATCQQSIWCGKDLAIAAGVLFTAVGALYVASAATGYSRVARCSRETLRWNIEAMRAMKLNPPSGATVASPVAVGE